MILELTFLPNQSSCRVLLLRYTIKIHFESKLASLSKARIFARYQTCHVTIQVKIFSTNLQLAYQITEPDSESDLLIDQQATN